MKIPIVTKEEAVEFIMKQPDDRPINFMDPRDDDRCGCLMVHIGREKGLKFNYCLNTVWRKSSKNYSNPQRDESVMKAIGWHFNTWGTGHINYKSLKEAVTKKQKQHPQQKPIEVPAPHTLTDKNEDSD